MCALLDAINALRCTEYQSAAQLVDCGLFVRKIDSSRRDICLRWPLATVAAAWRSVPSSSVALHRQLDSQQRNDIWIWKIGFVHEPFKDFKQFNCIQCMFFLSSYFFFFMFYCFAYSSIGLRVAIVNREWPYLLLRSTSVGFVLLFDSSVLYGLLIEKYLCSFEDLFLGQNIILFAEAQLHRVARM